MEHKALKTQVFTNDIFYNESAELPIDVDFLLPDYCPDIVKILKCRAVPLVASKSISGGNVTVDGTVTITVIYTDCNNKISAYEHQHPFSKTFETGLDCDSAHIMCKAKCEYINSRAVTNRKIDIHGAAGIYIKLLRRMCNDIIADYDDPSIELRRGIIPATTPMGTVEKYLTIEEEIEIGQGRPNIRSLIRYEGNTVIRECKLMNEKNVVKGEISVSILYCPTEGPLQKIHTQLPFSQLLEMPGVNEQCTCDAKADIVSLDVKPRTSATGEIKSFILEAKLLVTTTACCDNDVEVVLDAYSRKCEARLSKNDIALRKIRNTLNEVCQCKTTVDVGEVIISEVADIWCDVQSAICKTEEEKLIISGIVMANMIACDENDTPIYFEKPVEFKYEYSLGECVNVTCEPQVEVRSCSYTLIGDKGIELRLEIGIRASLYCTQEVSLITELTVDENKPTVAVDRGAMTIYFATAGESVWDIARRYRAGVEEIQRINGVEDILSNDSMIMVPLI